MWKTRIFFFSFFDNTSILHLQGRHAEFSDFSVHYLICNIQMAFSPGFYNFIFIVLVKV